LELVKRTTPSNGIGGLADFVDSGAVRGQGCFVHDPLEDPAIDRLMEYADQNGPTVVKAHCRMTPYLDQLIQEGKVVANPKQQIHSLAKILNVEVSDKLVDEILNVEAKRKSGQDNWMEFNQAKLTRYQNDMTQDQIELCNRKLGPWIEKFGYPLEAPCSVPGTQVDSIAS